MRPSPIDKHAWTVLTTPTGQIGFREFGGRFYVGCLEATGGVAALVQRVRVIARAKGYSRMYWQMFPATGFRMMKVLAGGRARIDRIDGYFLSSTIYIVTSITAFNEV